MDLILFHKGRSSSYFILFIYFLLNEAVIKSSLLK